MRAKAVAIPDTPLRPQKKIFIKTLEQQKPICETSASYIPKTPLGSRLMALREKVRTSGATLLNWDEVSREIAERRGESA